MYTLIKKYFIAKKKKRKPNQHWRLRQGSLSAGGVCRPQNAGASAKRCGTSRAALALHWTLGVWSPAVLHRLIRGVSETQSPLGEGQQKTWSVSLFFFLLDYLPELKSVKIFMPTRKEHSSSKSRRFSY